jgi:putative transposase
MVKINSSRGRCASKLVHYVLDPEKQLDPDFDVRDVVSTNMFGRSALELAQQIGQLKVELDWVKKNLELSLAEKKALIEPEHSSISISRQCTLVGLARSSFYYEIQPETEQNLKLMAMLDRQYTARPFYGVRKMTAWLATQGEIVNPKRVRHLLRKMGLEAIYPKPNLSRPQDNIRKYPYLLREAEITAPNQVWSTDITYIPLPQGYVYLVIDPQKF